MRGQASRTSPDTSWWIGPLSWDAFCEEVAKRFPEMSNTREGRSTDPCRGLNELKHLMSPARRMRIES